MSLSKIYRGADADGLRQFQFRSFGDPEPSAVLDSDGFKAEAAFDQRAAPVIAPAASVAAGPTEHDLQEAYVKGRREGLELADQNWSQPRKDWRRHWKKWLGCAKLWPITVSRICCVWLWQCRNRSSVVKLLPIPMLSFPLLRMPYRLPFGPTTIAFVSIPKTWKRSVKKAAVSGQYQRTEKYQF